MAKNESGEDQVEFTLRVVSKASAPLNMTESEVTSDSVTITWQAPLEDGGKPITQYVIYKRVSTRTAWQKVTKVTSTITSLTVKELQSSSAYDFRVVAETEQGEGEPAELFRIKTGQPKKEQPASRRTSAVGNIQEVAEKPKSQPKLTLNKTDITTTTNQIIQIMATFSGEPRPALTWYYNGQIISESRHYQIEQRRHDTVCIFTINKTEQSDTGKYTVKAKNDIGEAFVDFNLRILSSAGPPKNLQVSEITTTSATVAWDAPTGNTTFCSNFSKFKFYIFQKTEELLLNITS
jgi:Fibronectin type III domain/Immunoglobulin I-set domain